MSRVIPSIVILPGDDIESVVATLEAVAAGLPSARIHIARPGLAPLDATADLLASAGLHVMDVPGVAGFDAVLAAMDRAFGSAPYAWLFAGETLTSDHCRQLGSRGQLASSSPFAWLECPSPLAVGRVRIGGAELAARRPAMLSPFQPVPSWRAIILRSMRPRFSSYDEVYADVCALAHLGELDAAFQRAAMSWTAADDSGDRRNGCRLAKAAVLTGRMLGVSARLTEACARWFREEPEPYVAVTYASIAVGAVPFALVDQLLALAPPFGPAPDRGGVLVEPLERVLALRSAIAVERHNAKIRHDGVLKLAAAGEATPGEIGMGATLAFLLGTSPRPLVEALPAGEQHPMLGDSFNINLDANFVAETIKELDARFGGQAWLAQLVERFVLGRSIDAALAIDRAGLVGYPHWRQVAELAWLSDDARAEALVRAVLHGQLEADEARRRAQRLGAAAGLLLDAALREEVAA